MKQPTLAWLLFALPALVAGAACATDPEDEAPPFTNGVSTLTGASDAGNVDGPRGKARLHNPVNVAYGPDGVLYVADFDNGRIRAVDVHDGTTSTVIAAQGFQRPFAMVFAPDGTLYVSTDRNPQGKHGSMSGTIWKINIAAKTATPIVSNVGRPRGMVVAPNGLIVFADYEHHVIQTLDPRSGIVTPLAGSWDAKGMVDGTGPNARFSTPYGMVYAGGKIIVADFDNHRLRVVGLDGKVTTLAGTGVAGFRDGAMQAAMFNKPQGLAATANGDIYVTDLENYRIRRISVGGTIETIAGNGEGGYADNDDRLAAELYGLEGLTVTPDGSMVFVADGGRGEPVPFNRVRSIKMQ